MIFIADLIACSTYFGHHYAHHQELESIIQVVAACGVWCFGFHTDNLKTKVPNTTGSNHLYNTLELLMMGIMVPETCWVSKKICNKNHLLYPVGILFPQFKSPFFPCYHTTEPAVTFVEVWLRSLVYKDLDRSAVNTPQLRYKNHSVNAVEINKCVCHMIHLQHGNTFCGHNAQFPNANPVSTPSNSRVSSG